MFYKKIIRRENVVDLADFRQQREASAPVRMCRFCGAGLNEGEREEDCSGAWPGLPLPAPVAQRRFRADVV